MPTPFSAAVLDHTDSFATVAAVALIAYVSADVAHHALGHGVACLAQGGRIESLSSVFVRCSCTGAAIDLAGPLANLLLGLGALGTIRFASLTAASARLFWSLTAAFNLFYFAGQLLFSAATRTDDWAWPLRYFHVAEPVRFALMALGCTAYVLTVRLLATQMASFAAPRARATALVYCAWTTAGLTACLTAAFDRQPAAALLYHAVPQSLLLPLGLLFVPVPAARRAALVAAENVLAFSLPWAMAAAVVGLASLLILGPGIALAH